MNRDLLESLRDTLTTIGDHARTASTDHPDVRDAHLFRILDAVAGAVAAIEDEINAQVRREPDHAA